MPKSKTWSHFHGGGVDFLSTHPQWWCGFFSHTFTDPQLFLSSLKKFKHDSCLDELLEDEDERRAFFINIYNCLTIHALAEMAGTPSDSTGDATSLPTSPLKVENMWGSNAYNIGGKNFLVCARHQLDPNIFAFISRW